MHAVGHRFTLRECFTGCRRRYRLQQAALAIESDRRVDFADLAVRLGWYDQAHFTNEFRSMLGCSPGEYAQRHR
ncbi:helix-turn-helix domain-containing protein [Mycobacterium intracellulare]|uniref:helix-turn-helix domain-containing protein n=1 Tax=Mycobacterium intracellulare TaxID=1767 RepID=UPI0021E660BC|nr:helix-turn-helix domain-containing protein [Mycobacterium intracellulare]MDM3894671.1 helix-turn-helix domain-containing protein [Mycobacterium intracellulare]MEE3804514.1 helix-turn-helix domain-containing protein [Mycobacterium intracellulare]WVL05512.1 helix-turn-helix domain-containing protein [Mycobacterium intracellulare]